MVGRPERAVPGTASTAPADAVRALVRAAAGGDAGAFRKLVEMHMRAVHALAYRLLGDADDADDVAQETFVRAHAALDRYDERYTFYTWLRTIAVRLALNEIAKRRRRRTEGGEGFETAAQTVESDAPAPDQWAERRELEHDLARALERLPEEFRSVLVLRVYEDLSYEEIAGVLAIPEGTVMSRLSRGRALLRAALAAHRSAPPGEARREG